MVKRGPQWWAALLPDGEQKTANAAQGTKLSFDNGS